MRKLISGILRALQALLNNSAETIGENYKTQQCADYVQPPPPAVVSISNFPPEIAEYYRSKAQKKPRPKAWRYTKRVLEIVGILTALGLAYLTWRTLQEIKRQAGAAMEAANTARDTLIASNRSWIGVEKFNVGVEPGKLSGGTLEPIQADKPIIFNLLLFNFGKSPAQFDEIGMLMEVRSTDVPEKFDYAWKKGPFTIFPNKEMQTIDSPAITIKGTEFEQLSLDVGKKHLVMHATIRYHDRFGSHWTNACYLWNLTDRRFSSCQTHNDSDQ